jgi:hypothetical protein
MPLYDFHSWASASEKLTPASVFRHPSPHSGTGPKKCRTALLCSGTGPVSASLTYFSPVPDLLNAGKSGIPVLTERMKFSINTVYAKKFCKKSYFYRRTFLLHRSKMSPSFGKSVASQMIDQFLWFLYCQFLWFLYCWKGK